MTLPAAVALILIPTAIVSVLFERGAFGIEATQATAAALAAFASGLPAYVLVKVVKPAFFAREDTATPFNCGVAAMIANTVLGLVLFAVLGLSAFPSPPRLLPGSILLLWWRLDGAVSRTRCPPQAEWATNSPQ